jgi:copper(I)-binding protein
MKFLAFIAALSCFAMTAAAQETGPIHLAAAEARPTPAGAMSGVVYLIVMNHGATDDTLSSVATPIAESASMHQTTNENGIMKMEPVAAIPLKANEAISFKPNGLHIMLTGLKQQLKIGDSFPITLNFAVAGAVTTTVKVERVTGKQEHDMGAMPGMKM